MWQLQAPYQGDLTIKWSICERNSTKIISAEAPSNTKDIKDVKDKFEPAESKSAPVWPEEDPFVLTPADKSFAYVHVRAEELQHLKQAILDGKVAVLIGPLGVGKTTLCEQIVDELKIFIREHPEGMKGGPILPVFLPGAAYSKTEDFIRGILTELAIDVSGERAQLISMLINWPKQHQERLAVMIDDVSESRANVSELGEFLRALADVERISLVLNGEPKKMKRFLKEIPSLNDRVQARIELKSMDKKEIDQLIRRRAELAGVDGHVTDDAYEEIYKLSKGVPRNALKIASNAFRLASMEKKLIDKEIVKRANKKSFWVKLFGRLRAS